MDTDERFRWLELRISTSLRPRADDLKSLFIRDESKATVLEFFSNDEAHHLFVYTLTEDKGGIRVSTFSPKKVSEKCLCFVKTGTASQLHAGNFDDGVTCLDWSEVLPHADLFVRDIFLPLLCTDTELMLEAAGEGLVITSDKLMDILHRLLGNLEVSRGVLDGAVTLPLPCIEVLAEAAVFQQRQPAVIHVLESAVVGWIRQIRNVLRHDSLTATKKLSKEANEPIRPHHELEMWEQHIQHATSILKQLDAPVATDILLNLNQAGSAYARSFGEVREEIEHALEAAKARLRCFATVLPWIQDMYRTSSVDRMLKVFPPLLHTVLLIWKHSDYYHDPKPFAQLLKMLSDEVVARARSLVGDNPFEDTQHSYIALKDALRLCAAFRGTYLDFKERANAYNTEKIESTVITMARLRPKDKNVLFRAKMYGPTGYQQWLSRVDQRDHEDEEGHWVDSAWPARNDRCFNGLSRFVERCNDLLDLVETTRHFLTLEEAAKIGGAGSRALDALISDIHQVFIRTIRDFTSHNHDVLTIDEKQHFEKAFFNYRSVIKTLEHRLADVLRKSIKNCPNAMSHLRVLEVFEGISARELLQKELQTENHSLIIELTKEFRCVKSMFKSSLPNVPRHLNMPPTVSKLVWVRSMKQRVGVPMAKVRQVCPHALESDLGWQLRDAYTETMNEVEKYETRLITMWSRSVDSDLRDRLKQAILAVEQLNTSRDQSQLWVSDTSRDPSDPDLEVPLDPEDKGQKVTGLKVNLDSKLLEMLRDVHYLQKPPHNVVIPPSVKSLLRSVDSSVLQTRSTRLRTIVSKYNHVVQWMQDHEQLLFENKMRKVGELIAEGTENVTWGSADLDDFLEKCSSIICDDVHSILTRVHNNWDRVKEMSKSWSEGALDIFTGHLMSKKTKSLHELLQEQSDLDEQYKMKLIPSGLEIHNLLQDSFNAVEMSAASPAWQLYTAQMDAMVLMALKSSILTSLDAMYTIIADSSTEETQESVSILEIRLELVEQTVSFSPPLDRSSSVDNVEDAVSQWLSSFNKRSTLIKRLTDPESSYSEFLSNDQDVWEVVEEIQHAAEENTAKCKQLLSIFDNYKFLWVQDVQQSFTDFLNGRPSPNPLRVSKQSQGRRSDMERARLSTQRSRYSVRSPDAINEAERAFLTSNHSLRNISRGTEPDGTVVPGLAEFDDEIGIYRTARDNILALPDRKPVGWLLFDFQPIKQVLTTYASKWMWTFIKYLCDQVTDSLDTLADFLARTEPEIESITGEERDTASFMKMMRLFNEVSAQQQDMDGRFSVMQRTVDLLEKYDMKLPNETQEMFKSAPDRWNHLKTKVSLAKQRLGPRIQEESDRITRDLLRFSDRVEALATELRTSDVFSREYPISAANHTIDAFARRLKLLQAEAQDLIELQELLDTAVVNFSVLPQYQRDLRNLKLVWDHVWMVEAEQREWKMKHWQKIDTKHLQQAVQKQKDLIQSLPPEVTDWDVYAGMIASVTVIEQCLPLVEDLNHPAMRTRHWKQLVRITGGLLQTDTDSLRKMVVGDLLELGLQKHGDEVKSIVQRAVKDLTIESSLKTCEEVWLSKVFEIRPHTRGQSKTVGPDLEAGSEVTGSEMMPHALLQTHEGSRTGGTRTKSMKSGPHSRSSDKTGGGSVSRGRGGGRTSVLSLPVSLLNLVDDPSPICLLKNVEKIFSELEHHQVELNRMQSNSAIGSFLDEVTKWQKRLHLIEAVLEAWVSVQMKWVQLDDVYSGADVRTALAHEANMFAVMSKDFRLLMRATEKNTNVLQSCSRKGLLPMLEKMDIKMESCRHALLGNLERRRQRFPRFYFLSPEDVMNIVCYGYDLDAVNKYLCKILPHLGKLVFEEVTKPTNLTPPPRHTSASPKKKYKVTGVSSSAGEVMTFHRPLVYEGPMSLWLPQLLMSIQATLQENLHIALGNEARPAQIVQTLRSAGASRVRISRPSSAVSQRSGSDNIPRVAVTVAHQTSDTESLASAKGLPMLDEKPSTMATQLSTTLGASIEPTQVSWTLDNPTQIVLLATTVQMNGSIQDAIEKTSKGDDLALIKVADLINNQLSEAVIMLKGMEDERAVRLRSAKKKGTSHGRERNEEGGKVESDASESIRAPSTRSMLDDDMEGADDTFNEDALGGGDTGGGPINTMQSLLFTEQVRSGSRGTRGDILDGDANELNNQDGTEVSNQPDGKLLLFPSQIQKISGLISIMTQQRDVCHHMRKSIFNGSSGRTDPNELFEWQMKLHHKYNPDNMEVKVHVNQWCFDYGFEYQGSAMRYVVSPSCDRVLLSMCQALQTNTGVAISNSSTMSGAPESLCELSYQLGRALYNVVCTQSVDHYMLGDLFKGLAETGCWMCLSRFDSLSAPVLSVAGQLAAEVQKALRGGKPSITLMSEEVTLSPTAACFITLDGAKEPQKSKTGFKSMLNVAVPTMLALPEECSTYFRTVNAVQPDRRLVLEIQLLSQGFTQADQLSRKLCVFLDLCSSLLSTLPTHQEHDPAMRENSSAAECSKHGIGCHDNSYTSISLMEHVITGAGVVLDVLFREQIEMKHEYREVIASKTRKFAGIWKHRSSLMSSSGGLVPSSNAADDNGHDGLLGIGVSASSLAPSVDPTTQEAIQANKDREVVESDAEAMRKMEEVAVVTALRNILAPRLPMKEDRSLVSTFVMDLWPDADVDFGLEEEEEERTEVPRGEFTSPPEDWDEEMNADVTIPDNLADSETRPFDPKLPEHEPVNDVEAAVAIATKECGLSPAVKFQAKAAQLTELSESIKSVIVCGSAGCGKSKCVEVYTQTQKQLGFHVICKKVYINAIDSQRKLFGYFESPTREWKDGLMQTLLRPHCLGQDTPTSTENSLKPNVFILHVDGKMRAEDTDLFLQILRTQPGSGSWLSLPNNERLRLPPDLRVIWEMENLASLDPSVISKLGVLGFNSTEVTWKLHLSHWLQNLPDSIVSITKDIVMRYLPTLVNHFSKFTAPAHLVDNGAIQLQQTIRISNQAMTATFCKLMDCFLPHSEDVSPVERERFVGYCAFWAFGGTLEGAGRDSFASWWSETWPNLFPINGSDVWRQFVDVETRLFARWEDHLPQFSGSSLVSGAFVPTPDTCQLTHIVGALLDAGHAAMIVGPPGCGKSALVRERIHTVSSGEVAEVLSLFLHCNRLTEAGTLWKQVSQHLEWKHGVTYTPRGNKKLLCMVDDVNLSRPLGTENENMCLQSACELIRQHLDVGGVRNPNTNKWQQVSSTSYVTTCNPNHTGTSCAMSQRMTRHFSVFSCPYPSATSQHAIYSTLVQSHFLVEPSLSNRTNNIERDRAFQNLLSSITLVTVELQERLRGMYLSTPERAHYTFALNDLERIFRNLMLSLGPDCHQRELLLLWRHECDWSYGKRMVSDVDCERYLQALDTAVRKHLTENKYLPLVLASKQPLFSSVRELDSGLVTAGRHFGRNSSRASGSGNSGGHVTDYYKPAQSEKEVQQLLMEAVKEYNKINVQMKLSLYSDTIALVCRLARVIQSPHPISHTLLFGDGCPVLAQLTVNLAAHLGGFRVVTLPPIIAPSTTDSHSHNMGGPSSSSDLERTRLAHMKKHLVQLYNQAGVKGEKLVFLLHDDKEVTHECLTMVEELVRHGSISHLFTNDEQTTIANSVRSEVTAAGLTYSRDVAWNFFLNTVTKNLRVVFICSQTGAPFMEKSLEFPALFSRMSCVALDHWCHDQLVANAMYHVTNGDQDTVGIPNDLIGGEADHVMDDRWRENVVHLLANMHVTVREKDNNKFYKIQGHVCNYAFEKLVERFVCVYRDRRKMVQESHESIKGALENIDRENLVAEALQKDLDREKQVLDEHKSGTLKLLAQIGQDMVITEQQVSAVRKQIRKIRHLKKSLPEYELAHEKAVFKAAAIVADTKTVVKEINIQDLSELRSLQKPDSDVEDLMAAIIMILKSPNSDVTWSKGAKRQMANLDRFLDELANFDEVPMPQGTLENLESFWEKETFTPENLTAKAGGNTAAGSLLKWVQGVVRYHTTMINRVKPLHAKVQETASSIGDAQHKLRQLESKKGALEARLHDLAEGFEQATADKNTQEEKRMEMQDHLRVAAEFRQVLTEEHKRCCAALNSHKYRIEWVTGAAAIAAGFAIYLAPYPFMFRRMMLTVDWAQCLVEKGIPLVFDSTDPVKGHNVEFMLDVNEGGLESAQATAREGNMDDELVVGEGDAESEEPSINLNQSISNETADSEKQNMSQSNLAINGLPPVAEESDAEEPEEEDVEHSNMGGSSEIIPEPEIPDQPIEEMRSKTSEAPTYHTYTIATLPYISAEEYHIYVNSVIKVLVGEDTLQDWLTKDFAHHQLQNAAVMLSSWQRPPLLLDPYLAGADWCAVHLRRNPNITPVNLTSKIENTHVMSIEKSVLGGHTLMLMDCEHQAGALVRPLIHHSNTAGWRKERSSDESQTVRFLGRRLLCPDSFLLYLTTTQMTANRLHPDITAATQLISYVPSTETLQEDLLLRAVSRVRPDIYRERHRVSRAIRQHRHTLAQLDSILCERLVTGDDPRAIENSTKFLSNVVQLKQDESEKLATAEELLMTLTNLVEELYPIAQRGAFLYSLCRAIPSLNPHYQVPLPYFTHLFDTAVGSEYEEEEEEGGGLLQDVAVVHPSDLDEDGEEEKMKMAAKRKASLRLGSARKMIKKRDKMKETLSTTAEEDEREYPEASDHENTSASRGPPEAEETEVSDRPGSGSHVAVPDVATLPTRGVEYTSFPAEKVQEIVEILTKRIFASVYGSVCPEHRLQVTALALLNIQLDGADAAFTEEEMTLLVHGNPGFGRSLSISLSDFECSASVPDWLPADRWEDLLAFSVLPGSLEGLCVRVAENNEQWKAWFHEVAPETVPFPASSSDNLPDDDSNPELSDFQRLLLIRTLRADRLEPALRVYVEQHIEGTPMHEVVSMNIPLDLDTLFKDVSNTLGILVLLPDIDEPNTETRIVMRPEDAIKRLAQKYKVNVESVLMGDGYVQEAGRCIDTALAQDTWALINGLHLAPAKFFEDLQIQLARVGNISRQSESGNNDPSVTSLGSHFQVWMTSRPHQSLPSLLSQYLYKLSWDTLLKLALEDSTHPSEPKIMSPPTSSVIKSCLISSMARMPSYITTQWTEADKNVRRLLYAICFCHALLVTRQCFGWHGNNKYHPLRESVLRQAMTYALAEKSQNAGISLAKCVYDDVILTTADQRYVHQLFDNVVEQIASQKGQKRKAIEINEVQFPIPPSETTPTDYPAWLSANLPDDIDLISALALPSTATTWQTTQSGEKMLLQLQDLFNAVQQPGYESNVLSPGQTQEPRAAHLTLQGLQNVIDLCSEKLPPLLNLGRSDKERLLEFNFPYHRASVLSSGNPEVVHMPESIGFVLLQECIWFNQCVCHVRQQLHLLRTHLFATSDYKLSSQLLETAQALSSEEVPPSWQHLNESPNTHVLLTWLDDITKRYKQFRSWIKSGSVPLDGKTPVGNLSSVWLGGLVNPGALLMALCQEKAVLHDSTLDQIRVSCTLSHDDDAAEHEAGIFLEGVSLLNGKWDLGKECVTKATNDVTISDLPSLFFYPTLMTSEEEEENVKKQTQENLVEYPVYMNLSRQSFVCYLPLPSENVSRFSELHNGLPLSTNCDIILQTGPDITQRDAFKSRAYLANKRREQWSRVSPEVSELMSRSGTRMSSARNSGPRMSIASLPPSITGTKQPTKPTDTKFKPQPQRLLEEGSVTSQSNKSLSSHASSHLKQPQKQNPEETGHTQRTLPNGHVMHPKPENQDNGSLVPPTGEEDQENEPEMEREGSLLQTILNDEQPSDDDRSFATPEGSVN